ncbi:hypothetical protein RND81_08G119000 [Saponaria officinalis]|uniref:Protein DETOXIFICATION n=1 Tax=Saponaria officinalis TaxID=3572 RepID=A0AAW1J6H0_SAPOF
MSTINQLNLDKTQQNQNTKNTINDPLLTKNPSSLSNQNNQQHEQTTLNPPKTHLKHAIKEAKSITHLALPLILTGLLLYSRSMISMLFLGHIGELALAGGSLAIGFANITGYSILSGLAMGMEPICGQAFGAKKYKTLGLIMQRTILLLLLASLPISLLWLNMKKILLFCYQDEKIASQAQCYIIFNIPDLITLSFLHPIRIYLRTQSITRPLTYSASFAIFLHIPVNYFFVIHLNLGVKGVALSSIITNFTLVTSLIIYIILSGIYTNTWCAISFDCLKGWKTLINLAIPSCISVCLEWWWYEIMILLCGLLSNPKITVSSMGILIQTTSLIYIFPSSLSFSVSTLVGNNLGANKPKIAKITTIIGLFFSFILGFTALFFTIMVRKKWATFFTQDLEIITLTSKILPIIGLCELGNCPQTIGCGVLRGEARPKLGAFINLGSFYLVGMPIALWLGFKGGFGFTGLWLGLMAAQISCLVTMLVVVVRTDWKAQAQRAQELTHCVGLVKYEICDVIEFDCKDIKSFEYVGI